MKALKTVCLLLGVTGVFAGLSISPVESQSISFGGGMDTNFHGILSGNDPKEGKKSIWEYPIYDTQFTTPHIHPKMMMDLSEKLSGEIYICFTHHDTMSLITAFMDYELYSSGEFGADNLDLKIGRFLIPFGYFNSIAINPVDQKSVSRPLMWVDHEQEDMELHGGPRPIFMSAYSDIGAQLYGSKWLHGKKDQLWYGIYVVGGMYQNQKQYESGSRLDVDWESEPRPTMDNNNNKSIGARVAYSYGDLFTVGSSYTGGKYDVESKLDYSITGVDGHLALSKANLRFEYATNPIDWINKSGAGETEEGLYNNKIEKYTKSGWYVQADCPFNQVFQESKLAEKFELVAMYSFLEHDRAKGSHTFLDMSRFSLGVNFAPEPSIKFRLEYQLTMLGDYNDIQKNIDEFGKGDFDNLSRIQMNVGMAF